MEQTEKKTRDHQYFFRKPKPCIKCEQEQNMPSSSYCKSCMRAYVNSKRMEHKEKRESTMENYLQRA